MLISTANMDGTLGVRHVSFSAPCEHQLTWPGQLLKNLLTLFLVKAWTGKAEVPS